MLDGVVIDDTKLVNGKPARWGGLLQRPSSPRPLRRPDPWAPPPETDTR